MLVSQDMGQVSKAINQFGMDAGYELSYSPDYLISPASISTALGMTYLGAAGITKEQFEKVLYYPKESEILDEFKVFMNVFENTHPGTTISMANKLWAGQNRIDLNTDFVKKNKDYFRSELEFLDFGNSSASSNTINNWVADKTDNKIVNLIDPGIINSDVVLILTNAIYFKSNWAKKFDPKLTRSGKFTNEQKEKISVDFMINDGSYQTYEDGTVNLIELPYEGETFSFLIMLPKVSMKELEDKLIAENYEQWIASMNKRKFELVQVPRFKSSSRLKLKQMLTDLGMPNAFQGANFDGMGSARGRIELSEVVHETYMEFNEEGTEVAAATGVVAESRSAASAPKRFIADRPFLYALRHIESNTILFFGKMSNPKY